MVRNQVEAAYARSDLFERRRILMDDWACYLTQWTAGAEAFVTKPTAPRVHRWAGLHTIPALTILR